MSRPPADAPPRHAATCDGRHSLGTTACDDELQASVERRNERLPRSVCARCGAAFDPYTGTCSAPGWGCTETVKVAPPADPTT